MTFEGTALWRVRQKAGHDLILWPGATVLVLRDDGKILLGRRGDSRGWAMPGGGSEEGSSFTATALQELREEVGLEADPDDLEAFATVSEPENHLIEYANGDRTHYQGVWFVLRRWRGDPRPDGDEFLELGWFDPGDPPPMIHSNAIALELYRRYVETGRFQAR
jgi:8-oxo-dGTP pyrophosphatase MutT (NUDIX family)